jgi:hypothetical protein
MDQVLSDRLQEAEWESLMSGLSNGLILVRSNGEIAWMDDKTRRRVNGGLQNLDLPIRKSDGCSVDCFVTAVPVTINGERTIVCVIQEMNDRKEFGHDLLPLSKPSWPIRLVRSSISLKHCAKPPRCGRRHRI